MWEEVPLGTDVSMPCSFEVLWETVDQVIRESQRRIEVLQKTLPVESLLLLVPYFQNGRLFRSHFTELLGIRY